MRATAETNIPAVAVSVGTYGWDGHGVPSLGDGVSEQAEDEGARDEHRPPAEGVRGDPIKGDKSCVGSNST